MTITCDTSLDSILNYDTVNDILKTAGSNIRDCTRPRRFNVGREIETEGIKNAQIDSKNPLYEKGSEVYKALGTFHTSLSDLESLIRKKTRNQEILELETLIAAIDTKINALDAEYDSLSYQIDHEEDPEEAARLEKKATRIYNSINSYKTKRKTAVERMKSRGSVYDIPEPDTDATTAGSNPSGLTHQQHTDYTLQSGEMVSIDGQVYTVEWIAKDANGNHFVYYADGNGQIHIMGPDGQMTATEYNTSIPYLHHIANDGELEFYNNYSTNSENASQLGLPPSDTFVQGPTQDVIDHSLDTTYVNYGTPNPENVTTVTSSEELQAAAAAHAPVITINATELEDNQNLLQNLGNGGLDMTANEGETTITLVLNETTGMYYQMDSNGGYTMDMYGELTPEKLQNFTLE